MKYLDIDGEKLVLGGEIDKSLQYIKSMFYTVDNERITVDESGTVSFDVSGLDMQSDAAYELLNNIVTSEETFLFEVTNETYGLNRETGEKVITDLTISSPEGSGHVNYSITPRNISGGVGGPGLSPKSGYSGQVSLGPGVFTFSGLSEDEQPIGNMVFHELAENYFRTVSKQPYTRLNGTGAHQMAVDYAKNYKKQVGTPGVYGRYKYEKDK